MKKIIGLIMLSIMMLLFSACSDSDSDSGEKSQNFTATSGYPATDRSVGAFGEPLLENVMEKSDEVTFDIFNAGELIETDDQYEALESGSTDIAMSLSASLDPKRFPYSSVVGLPLLESDAHIAAEAMKNLMESDVEIMDGKTFYELEFEDKGLFAFPVHPTETYLISTTEKKLEKKEDFDKSTRIRVSSNVHEIFIEELGLTAITLSATDLYDGLSRGALDGVMFSVPDWPSYGIDELSNYAITGLSLGHFPMFFTMTQETWDSFSEDTQNIFNEEADALIESAPEFYKEDTEEILSAFEDDGGELLELDQLDTDVQEKVDTAILTTWETWIDGLEERDLGGNEVALLWRDLIVDAGGKVPQEIMDLE